MKKMAGVVVSADEQLALATNFLLSSPPGEIKEVLRDVSVLCPLLSDQVSHGVFHKYNNKMSQVLTSGDISVIMDECTEIDPSHYYDSRHGNVIQVDQMAQEIVDQVSGVDVPSKMQGLDEEREAVESAMQRYIDSQYAVGTTTCNVVPQGDILVVLISGEKLNLKNFWGGRWQSKFYIDLDSKTLEGVIKVYIHYFEDGNVQMNTDKSVDNVSISFSGGNADDMAKAVVAEISNQESEVQDSLEEMYVNMSKETFKDMRRVLPITRQKMDWSGAQMQLAKGFKK